MDKEIKKKVAGGAAAVTAAAGAVVAGAASVMSQDNESVDAVAEGAPIADGEVLADGGSLPEVEVLGNAPLQEGGVLPEATVTGHAHTAEAHGAVAHESETNEVAQQGSIMNDDDDQNDVTGIIQEAVEEEPDAPSFAFDPDEEQPNMFAQIAEKAEELGAKIFGDSSEDEQAGLTDHMNNMDVTGFN